MSFLKLINIFITIFLILLTKCRSDIANCKFENTVELTWTNEIEIDSNLVAYYDYKVLSNGTLVNVAQHKRACICPDPCINICNAVSLSYYYEDEELQPSFERNITLKSGHEKTEDLVQYFNVRFKQPCAYTYPLRMEIESNEKWSIFENGTIIEHSVNVFHGPNSYCFDWKDVEKIVDGILFKGSVFIPNICGRYNENYFLHLLKNWALVCSIPFLVATILLYCCLPELQNCHSKCFVMYLIYLTVSYALISYMNLFAEDIDEMECIIMGYLIYFATIGSLIWISIISYDTFVTLTGFYAPSLFRKYFKCGFLVPSIATFMVFVVQSLDIEESLKPGIENGNCGVSTKRWSAVIYYYIPHIVVLILCMTMYIKLIRFLLVHERDVTRYSSCVKNSHKKRFTLYFRLFVFMGVSWFFEILSYFLERSLEIHTVFIFITDLLTALNGLFVFISIASSSNIFQYIRKCFGKHQAADHGLITNIATNSSLDVLPDHYNIATAEVSLMD